MKRRAFTTVEVLIAIAASAGVLLTIILVWVQSSSNLTSGQANLSHLYECGRIISLMRTDLDGTLSIAPPFTGDPRSSIEFSTLMESLSPDPFRVEWRYDETKRSVIRSALGRDREFGRGRVSAFTTRIITSPACDDLAKSRKVCVEISIKLGDEGGRVEDGRQFSLTHVVTPLNLNLFLKSRYSFNH